MDREFAGLREESVPRAVNAGMDPPPKPDQITETDREKAHDFGMKIADVVSKLLGLDPGHDDCPDTFEGFFASSRDPENKVQRLLEMLNAGPAGDYQI